MTRDQSRDVYQLFVERTARAATVVTSNRDTSDWLALFDDPLLEQSAVDRFRNNAYDLVLEGECYRARLEPDRQGRASASTPVIKVPKPPRRRRRPKV
jgi:DNA replication protein DnaC